MKENPPDTRKDVMTRVRKSKELLTDQRESEVQLVSTNRITDFSVWSLEKEMSNETETENWCQNWKGRSPTKKEVGRWRRFTRKRRDTMTWIAQDKLTKRFERSSLPVFSSSVGWRTWTGSGREKNTGGETRVTEYLETGKGSSERLWRVHTLSTFASTQLSLSLFSIQRKETRAEKKDLPIKVSLIFFFDLLKFEAVSLLHW